MQTLHVSISGANTPLGIETISRLLHQGHIVNLQDSDYKKIQEDLAEVLAFCTGKISNLPPNDSIETAITFFQNPSSIEFLLNIDAKMKMFIIPSNALSNFQEIPHEISTFVIHDLIHPQIDAIWGAKHFSDWLLDSKDEITDRICHWVSWRDVVDAICVIAGTNIDLPSRVDICGRRSISLETTKREFMRLLDRSKTALSSTLGIEHLTSEEENFQSTIWRKHRPDLNPLHELLTDVGKDGWHPLMGVEVSILEWIAHNLEM